MAPEHLRCGSIVGEVNSFSRRSRSSVHRVLGRPCRRCALSLWSKVGSQCRAIVFHSRLLVRRTFRAYLHLRRLCMVTQSSRRSLCNRASISCVHRLIQSTHGSKHSVGSRSGGAGLGSEVLLSTSSSLVESPFGGAWGSCDGLGVCCVNADDGVVVVAVVVGICCGAVVSVGCGCGARRRRGEWKIMRSICRCLPNTIFELTRHRPCFRTIQDRGTDCTMKKAEAIVERVIRAGQLLLEAVELPPSSSDPVFNFGSMWISEGEDTSKILERA